MRRPRTGTSGIMARMRGSGLRFGAYSCSSTQRCASGFCPQFAQVSGFSVVSIVILRLNLRLSTRPNGQRLVFIIFEGRFILALVGAVVVHATALRSARAPD